MNAFQILGLVVIAMLIATSLINLIRGRGRISISFLWLSLWCLGAVALVWPDSTLLVARSLGIKRGADLVFYSNVFATLGGFFFIYLRQRRVERQLTLLVREMAIAQAALPEESEASGRAAP